MTCFGLLGLLMAAGAAGANTRYVCYVGELSVDERPYTNGFLFCCEDDIVENHEAVGTCKYAGFGPAAMPPVP